MELVPRLRSLPPPETAYFDDLFNHTFILAMLVNNDVNGDDDPANKASLTEDKHEGPHKSCDVIKRRIQVKEDNLYVSATT